MGFAEYIHLRKGQKRPRGAPSCLLTGGAASRQILARQRAAGEGEHARMNRTAKKIWNAASTVLVALVVLLAVLLVGVRLVGLQVFTVLSGSMEPTYHTGSLIYVKKIDTADIQPGNVITITNSTSLIQTGQLNWPVAVLGGLGVLLIALGLITSARRRKASRA